MQQDNRIAAYLVALQKLIQLWRANQQIPTKRLFAETWHIVHQNESTFASPFSGNRFNVSWRNFVFSDVARNLKAERPDFVPEIKFQFPSESRDALDSSIFVTLHSEVEFSIASALQRIGKKCVILSASKTHTTPTIYEHLSGVGKIVRDQNCLLLARRELNAGSTLVAPVDYTLYDQGAKTFLQKIGMGVFDFAKKCRFQISYILPVIGNRGEITLFVDVADPGLSSMECADRFLEFCVLYSPNKINLSKDNWYADTRGKWDANLMRKPN